MKLRVIRPAQKKPGRNGTGIHRNRSWKRRVSFSSIIFVGVCLYNDLHPEEMEPYIQKALELAENEFNRAECLFQRGIASMKKGEPDTALTLFQDAAKIFLTVESGQGMGWFDIHHVTRAIAGSRHEAGSGVFADTLLSIAK